MVKSNKIYSPQNYLEAVTGKCYIISGYNDVDFIQEVLVQNGYTDTLWDYPLSEIDHIAENKLNVVLVDCLVVDPDTNAFEHEYRWFEVPDGFEDE